MVQKQQILCRAKRLRNAQLPSLVAFFIQEKKLAPRIYPYTTCLKPQALFPETIHAREVTPLHLVSRSQAYSLARVLHQQSLESWIIPCRGRSCTSQGAC